MPTRSVALWATVMAFGTSLLGSNAHAGEADSVQFAVEFIDGSKDSPQASALGEQVESALRKHVGQTAEPNGDKRLVVVISDMPSAPGEDFLVRLVATAYGDEVASTEPLACVACGAEELATMAIDMLPPLLDTLATVEPPPVEAPPPEPTQADADIEPEPVPQSNRRQRALQIAGTTTAVAGGLGLGAGVALLVVGKVYPRDSNGLVIDQIDYRPAGAILAGVGGAMLVTGLVCFGLGSRKPATLVGVAPVLNREVTGASVTLAF